MADIGGSRTPPAWYPDPAGSGQQRYWDGATWTEHYAPGPVGAPGPMAGDAPPVAPASPNAPFAQSGPGQPAGYYTAASGYPGQAVPSAAGMSGCVKALVVGLAVAVVLGILALGSILFVGHRVVNGLRRIAPVSGRPPSLRSGEKDYGSERKQDHVAGSDGKVSIGALNATATDWSRTAGPNDTKLICGNVTIERASVNSSDRFGAAMQLAGDFAWELVTPSGTTNSFDPSSSSLSALTDYLTTNHTGPASGKICFPDPEVSGQYAITWQPRLLRPERIVWIVKLP